MNGFGKAIDKVEAFINAAEQNKNLWTMLEDIEKIPWYKPVAENLKDYVRRKGRLSDKQKSYVTSMYLDYCVITDNEIEKQREARKLLWRMRTMESDAFTFKTWNRRFISSLWAQHKPYTFAQLDTLNKIATKYKLRLSRVPEVADEAFDGWNVDYLKQREAENGTVHKD